jgi:hypothetical protein
MYSLTRDAPFAGTWYSALVDDRDVRLLGELHYPLKPTACGEGQRRLDYLELVATYAVAKQHKRVGIVVVA